MNKENLNLKREFSPLQYMRFLFNEINLTNMESRQTLDQTETESSMNIEVKKFIELEKKKYKKTNEFNDMINRH